MVLATQLGHSITSLLSVNTDILKIYSLFIWLRSVVHLSHTVSKNTIQQSGMSDSTPFQKNLYLPVIEYCFRYVYIDLLFAVDPLISNWVYYKTMSDLNYAECPHCSKIAMGREKVEEQFGIRNNGGHIMVQSWCRVCRRLGLLAEKVPI